MSYIVIYLATVKMSRLVIHLATVEMSHPVIYIATVEMSHLVIHLATVDMLHIVIHLITCWDVTYYHSLSSFYSPNNFPNANIPRSIHWFQIIFILECSPVFSLFTNDRKIVTITFIKYCFIRPMYGEIIYREVEMFSVQLTSQNRKQMTKFQNFFNVFLVGSTIFQHPLV